MTTNVKNYVEVTTYPTTANFGALFDRAGARLNGGYGSGNQLFMKTRTSWKRTRGLSIVSSGSYKVPTDDTNLAHDIYRRMARDFDLEGGLYINFENNMKPGGLGTSGAGAVAVVEIINEIYGLGLSSFQKASYASLGESQRHLDNVVPGVYGGITVVEKTDANELLRVHELGIPSGVHPGLVIPDLDKDGGTAAARKVTDRHVVDKDLEERMIKSLREGNFSEARACMLEDMHRENSVTSLRNEERIYKVDVRELGDVLIKEFGDRIALTPSGAGPAMFLSSDDPEVLVMGLDRLVRKYGSLGHRATGHVTPFI